MEMKPCRLPPKGWYCTREVDHDGPCAAHSHNHSEYNRMPGDTVSYSTTRVTEFMRSVQQVTIEEELQIALRDFLRLIPGIDKESLANTPTRFLAALREMTSGYALSPEDILGKVFEVECDELIILKGVSFTSVCEHHLLPFTGTADIGYIPGKVVGLSKLARLVDCFSRRLQMQETMTQQISKAIETHLEAKGVAVVTRAQHSCMSCRGIRKEGATMVCSSMTGVFRTEASARAEFLNLCRD